MERIKRTNPTIGFSFKEETGCGASYFKIMFNIDTLAISEVFCTSSSKGGCLANTRVIGRLVSASLQCGMPTELIINQLKSEICPSARYRAGHDAEFRKTGNFSCGKALASAIEKALKWQQFLLSHKSHIQEMLMTNQKPETPANQVVVEVSQVEAIKLIAEKMGLKTIDDFIKAKKCNKCLKTLSEDGTCSDCGVVNV